MNSGPVTGFVWADGIRGECRTMVNQSTWCMMYPPEHEQDLNRLFGLLKSIRASDDATARRGGGRHGSTSSAGSTMHEKARGRIKRHSYGVHSLVQSEMTYTKILRQAMSDIMAGGVKQAYDTSFIEEAVGPCCAQQIAMPCPLAMLNTLMEGCQWEWMMPDEVSREGFSQSGLWARGSFDVFLANGQKSARQHIKAYELMLVSQKRERNRRKSRFEDPTDASVRLGVSKGLARALVEHKSARGPVVAEDTPNPLRYNSFSERETPAPHQCGWMLGNRLIVPRGKHMYFDASMFNAFHGYVSRRPSLLVQYIVFRTLLSMARRPAIVQLIETIRDDPDFGVTHYTSAASSSAKTRALKRTKVPLISTKLIRDMAVGASRKRAAVCAYTSADLMSAPPCITHAIMNQHLVNYRRLGLSAAVAVVARTRGTPIDVFASEVFRLMAKSTHNQSEGRLKAMQDSLVYAAKKPSDRRACATRVDPDATDQLGCPMRKSGGPVACMAARGGPIPGVSLDPERITVSEMWMYTPGTTDPDTIEKMRSTVAARYDGLISDSDDDDDD